MGDKNEKKYFIVLTLSFVIFASFTSCNSSAAQNNDTNTNGEIVTDTDKDTSSESTKKEVDFTIGHWEDNVFENEWLNMKFTIPAEWNIATDEEIAEILGVGAEIISKSSGGDSEALSEIANLKTSYGFMAADSSSKINAQLIYENLAMSIGGTKITEEEYADIVVDGLAKIEQMGYEELGRDTQEIAGKTFYHVKLSLYDGKANQDYYLFRQDKYMVV